MLVVKWVLAAVWITVAAAGDLPAQRPQAAAPAQPAAATVQAQPQVPRDIDAFANRVLQEFSTPGAAIAVVRDGRMVFARGYGVRRLGAPEPVSERTRFQVASNTKAFTSAALAILVEDGRLRWDDRVIDHLPWFQLSDPYVTREITVLDLLVHRSGLGLGGGDLLWFHSNYTREELIRRLRWVPLATSFRSTYNYDNVLYVVAGAVIGAPAGGGRVAVAGVLAGMGAVYVFAMVQAERWRIANYPPDLAVYEGCLTARGYDVSWPKGMKP